MSNKPLSPDERRKQQEDMMDKMSKMNPTQLAQMRQKQAEMMKEKMASMDPAQLEQMKQRQQAIQQQQQQARMAMMNDPSKIEQMKKQQAEMMEKMKNMSPAQLEQVKKQQYMMMQQRMAQMTPQQQEQMRKQQSNMTHAMLSNMDPTQLAQMKQQQAQLLQQKMASMPEAKRREIERLQQIQNDPIGRQYYPFFTTPDGQGGNPFDTGNRNLSGIQKVVVRCGRFVDGITLFYKDGSNYRCGGMGGQEQEFVVPDGDYINKATIWSGWGTDAVQFHTKNGVESPRMGGPGGKMREERLDPGSQLIGMKGRGGRMVDSVSFKFAAI